MIRHPGHPDQSVHAPNGGSGADGDGDGDGGPAKEMANRTEVDSWAETSFGSSDPEELYSSSSLGALRDYTGTGYVDSNNGLRTGKAPTAADKNIDKAIASQTIDRKVVVYRGATKDFPTLSEGDSFKDDAFMSVSASEDVGLSFARGGVGERRVLMKMNLPKGSNAAFIGSGESELILGRGTSFKVTSVKTIRSGREKGLEIYQLSPA